METAITKQDFIQHIQGVVCVVATNYHGYIFGSYVKEGDKWDPDVSDLDIFFAKKKRAREFVEHLHLQPTGEQHVEDTATKRPSYRATRTSYVYEYLSRKLKIDVVVGKRYPAYDTDVSYVTVTMNISNGGTLVQRYRYGTRDMKIEFIAPALLPKLLRREASLTSDYQQSLRDGMKNPYNPIFVKQSTRIFAKYILRGWKVYTLHGIDVENVISAADTKRLFSGEVPPELLQTLIKSILHLDQSLDDIRWRIHAKVYNLQRERDEANAIVEFEGDENLREEV